MDILNIISTRTKAFQPAPPLKTTVMDKATGLAAVLIPIIKKTTPELLFTLRAQNLASHSGEVSFPGGHKELNDDTFLDTALRETHEEIGISPQDIEVIGELNPLFSIHGVFVKPYIGLLEDDLIYTKEPSEVAEIFSVPLTVFLQSPNGYTRRNNNLGKEISIPYFKYKHFTIWGLTALMTQEFIKIIQL